MMGKAILSPSSKQESASIPQSWSIYWGERLNVYTPKEAHSYSVFFLGQAPREKHLHVRTHLMHSHHSPFTSIEVSP